MKITEQRESETVQTLYHIVRIVLDKSELLVPQIDVVGVESVYELSTDTSSSATIAYLDLGPVHIPVYCLLDSLELGSSAPEHYTHCVVLQDSVGKFALLCREISSLQSAGVYFNPVPACMNNYGSPLTHLALYRNSDNKECLGLVTHAEYLRFSISQQEHGTYAAR